MDNEAEIFQPPVEIDLTLKDDDLTGLQTVIPPDITTAKVGAVGVDDQDECQYPACIIDMVKLGDVSAEALRVLHTVANKPCESELALKAHIYANTAKGLILIGETALETALGLMVLLVRKCFGRSVRVYYKETAGAELVLATQADNIIRLSL